MNYHDYLTELEIVEIEKFNQNLSMSEAVKKVLFTVVNIQGRVTKGQKVNPEINGALHLAALARNGTKFTNEELGADIRAYAHAVGMLDSGFREIVKIKQKQKEPKEVSNPAV